MKGGFCTTIIFVEAHIRRKGSALPAPKPATGFPRALAYKPWVAHITKIPACVAWVVHTYIWFPLVAKFFSACISFTQLLLIPSHVCWRGPSRFCHRSQQLLGCTRTCKSYKGVFCEALYVVHAYHQCLHRVANKNVAHRHSALHIRRYRMPYYSRVAIRYVSWRLTCQMQIELRRLKRMHSLANDQYSSAVSSSRPTAYCYCG